jgi:hypothetical protein
MRYNQLPCARQRPEASRSSGGSARFWIFQLLGLCVVICSLLLLIPKTPVALADGGAPNLAYVAGSAQGISVINIAEQKVTKTIALNGDPTMTYLSLDGRYLYIAQPGLNKITMLDANSGRAICSASIAGKPSLLAFDPGVNTLYVAGNDAPNITALDANNCAVKQTIQTSSPVYGMALAIVGSTTNGGANNQLWYSTASTINVFELPNKITSIAVAGGPQYILIQGATVYVTTRQGTVVAVSLQTLQVTPPLLTGGDFGKMDYDAFTNEVYIPDKKHDRIDVLTPIFYGSSIPPEPSHVLAVNGSPQSIAITNDGNLAFVALTGGNVAMLDIPGKQLLKTFSVGGSPLFVITGVYPPTGTTPAPTTSDGLIISQNILYLIAGIGILLLVVIALLVILARRQKA